jgi:hypothetical protein
VLAPPPEAVAPQQHHEFNNTRGFYTPKIADMFLELVSGCGVKLKQETTTQHHSQHKRRRWRRTQVAATELGAPSRWSYWALPGVHSPTPKNNIKYEKWAL